MPTVVGCREKTPAAEAAKVGAEAARGGGVGGSEEDVEPARCRTGCPRPADGFHPAASARAVPPAWKVYLRAVVGWGLVWFRTSKPRIRCRPGAGGGDGLRPRVPPAPWRAA